MIKNIVIENFRGINSLELKTNRINIFVGRNNAGKSSILEAIAPTLSASNKYFDALDRNILLYSLNKAHYNYLLRYGANYSKIAIKLDNGTEYSVHIVKANYLSEVNASIREGINTFFGSNS